MSWTYNLGQISTVAKDQIRFLIGDTDTTDQLLQDEEIVFATTKFGSLAYQAAACARAIAAKYSRLSDKEMGDLKLKASQKASAYTKMASDLEASSVSMTGSVPIPYAGGISDSDKDTNEDDTDRVVPSFTRSSQAFPPSDITTTSG